MHGLKEGCTMKELVGRFLADEAGAVSVEYGFAILFAAGIATAILGVIKNEVSSSFNKISDRLDARINAVS
jgi:Flp pilus assembly pilin Flp